MAKKNEFIYTARKKHHHHIVLLDQVIILSRKMKFIKKLLSPYLQRKALNYRVVSHQQLV